MNYLTVKTEADFSASVVGAGSVLIFAEQTGQTITLKAKLPDGTFATVSGGGGGGGGGGGAAAEVSPLDIVFFAPKF